MHGDVVAAARVLFAQPSEQRQTLIGRLLREAGWADAYRRSVGRVHPIWGDGSLLTAALLRRPPPEPQLSDSDYCTCLAEVFDALIELRA